MFNVSLEMLDFYAFVSSFCHLLIYTLVLFMFCIFVVNSYDLVKFSPQKNFFFFFKLRINITKFKFFLNYWNNMHFYLKLFSRLYTRFYQTQIHKRLFLKFSVVKRFMHNVLAVLPLFLMEYQSRTLRCLQLLQNLKRK